MSDKWATWDVSVDPKHVMASQSLVLYGGEDAEWVLKCACVCVCGLPFLDACVCAGLLTVALQQNVCPFLSPLMWPGPAVIMSPVPRRKVNILQFTQGSARAAAQPPLNPRMRRHARTHTLAANSRVERQPSTRGWSTSTQCTDWEHNDDP